MPVHFDSIMKNEEKENSVFLGIVKKDLDNPSDVCGES